jgi:uncharacterized protein (TIRG00374 family)
VTVDRGGLEDAQHQAAVASRSVRVRGQLLRLVVGLALGLVAGVYALRGTDLTEVWRLLSRVAPIPVVLSLLLVAITQPAKAFRWQAVAGGGRLLPFGQAMHGLLVGQALNLLAPFRVGDFARAYLVGRHLAAGSIFTFYTVVVAKALDALMLLVCLVVLLIWGRWPDWLSRSSILIGLLTVVVVGVGIAGAWLWQRRRVEGSWRGTGRSLSSRLGQRLLAPAAQLAEGLATARHDGRLWRMGLWSVAIWGLGAATNWAVFAALGLSVHWTAALLILVAIYAGVALPAPPGRVGVWHFLVVLVLTTYGIGQSQAVACGVLLHLVVVVPLLLAGGVSAWIRP